jgi:hypothetical protein
MHRLKTLLTTSILNGLILCGFGVNAYASSFSLSWNDNSLFASQQHFLETIESLTPDLMKSGIAEALSIDFSGQGFSPIAWGTCQNSQDFKTYFRENLYRIDGSNIVLNSDLRAALEEKPAQFRRSCFHGVDYNVIMGAIYQAVAEIYDRGPHSISRSSSFDHQTNYVISLFGAKNKQRKDPVSQRLYIDAEPRILSGPSKAFTAEFEDFEVDREFYCSHPGMWNYLNMVLNTARIPPACPKPFLSTLYDPRKDGTRTVEMDLKSIYRVEYIYALPGGKDLLGKFGHAMLHVIACSPAHPVPGPECETDFANHFFLTFNAEGVKSVLDGFTGKGVAELFVVDYTLKLGAYALANRKLNAIELNLTQPELATLIGTAWEWNQRYRERWDNLGNNCVTEILDLIRASVPSLESVQFPFVTPASLATLLQHMPLISNGERTVISGPPRDASDD